VKHVSAYTALGSTIPQVNGESQYRYSAPAGA